MCRTSLWQIFGILILYQLNIGFCLSLPSSSHGTSFTNWSEDDWFEKRFLIDKKFIFNFQRYENLIIRTQMNQWSLELSYGNRSHLNRLWTELHLFFDRRHYGTSLNHSIQGHINNQCNSPVISPLTNDSNIHITELVDMDQRIANYFITNGFFRTINYLHCTINERRLNPPIHIQLDIYFVTNREFQSLIYIEMMNNTQKLFSDHRARIYLHNHEKNLKYNFNISNIIYNPLITNTSVVHVIKLYDQKTRITNNSMMKFENIRIILFNLLIFIYFFHL